MQQQRKNSKYNPLSIIFFIAIFGLTYVIMPYILDFFGINNSKEVMSRIKNGQIFLEFLIFVGIFLSVAFALELLLRFTRKKKL